MKSATHLLIDEMYTALPAQRVHVTPDGYVYMLTGPEPPVHRDVYINGNWALQRIAPCPF